MRRGSGAGVGMLSFVRGDEQDRRMRPESAPDIPTHEQSLRFSRLRVSPERDERLMRD